MKEEILEEESAASSSLPCVVPSHSKETTIASSATDEEIQIIDSDYEEKRSYPMTMYATFVVKHPCILFGSILLLIILLASFSFIPQLGAPPLPNFEEPVKGFEARGTVISNRWRSQFNLIADELKGNITRTPGKCGKATSSLSMKRQQSIEQKAECTDQLTITPGELTMKLVFGTDNNQNLMTANNLKSICRLEQRIVHSLSNFELYCHKSNGAKNCCPSWSIGNYIAVLRNKASCSEIDERDVEKTIKLLRQCSRYYHEGNLTNNCWDFKKNKPAVGKCRHVHQSSCKRYNAVYNILHFLTDKNFMSYGSDPSSFLTHSLVLVPSKKDKDFQVGLYKSHLIHDQISEGNVVLSGFELSELKFAIFNERMLGDLYLAAIAMFVIVTILWFYTRSMLITALVGLIVTSALIIAYFIYTKVLGMKFFPFLNILTFVFLVGIGADDAFVYMDVWNQATREHNKERRRYPQTKEGRVNELISITADTMKHASLSMFVTSFTTASAFFASLTSEITSIRLFGLYSGISILCTLFLMVTWFPAAVIIDQTILSRCTCSSSCCTKLQQVFFHKNGILKIIVDRLIHWHRNLFKDFLPRIIIRLRFFWVIFFLGLAAGGIVVATVKPGLQLPSSQDFQMFREGHVLEKYPFNLKQNFHFETSKRSRFPINLIWGIKATDNGDQFDPYDTGSLTWDENFNVFTREGQKWISDLLDQLKKQPFFAKDQQQGKKCFVEDFFTTMNVNCSDKNRPCCKDSVFPYSSSVFSQCLLQMQCQRISQLEHSSGSITDEAPLFDSGGKLRVISLKFESDVPFTWSYDPADNFWQETETWIAQQFATAPSTTRGWFISSLKYYDLQKSLSKGTLLSMGLSLAIAFAVMLVTTRNILISILALITIVCALGVTVATLVLMGWKLNILESITLSVAVGLSIDFALHYGVAYVLASDKTDRRSRVQFSVSRMGSAITMAAFTTFVTGAIVLPSHVLSYIQLGHFLMLIMSVSWIYATFFFQALCSIVGPENDTGQLTLLKLKKAYQRLKECCSMNRKSLDHYQVMRKNDGTTVKREVRVVYVK